ncbi:MAG: hypothetical protein AAFV33_22580, partial [Chloroflexota bacterium]
AHTIDEWYINHCQPEIDFEKIKFLEKMTLRLRPTPHKRATENGFGGPVPVSSAMDGTTRYADNLHQHESSLRHCPGHTNWHTGHNTRIS